MKNRIKTCGIIIGLVATLAICTPVYAITKNSSTKATYSSAKLRELFGSKTNPKVGTSADPENMPSSNGFAYGDFGTYNSPASQNNLGGTPIYILGTIKSIEVLASTDDVLYGAFLVDECNGYQWCATMDIPRGNLELMRSTYVGKKAYIYGLYSGYSRDLSRPLVDITDIDGIDSASAAYSESDSLSDTAKSYTSASSSSSSNASSDTDVSNEYVWITKSGSRYHTISNCSGMRKASKVTLKEAQAQGYKPCDDCYNR